MKKWFLLFIILSQAVFAQTFDFNSKGVDSANKILEDYVEKEFQIDDAKATAYYFDVTGDNNQEVVGIIKTGIFYTLEGYKLIVLKKEDNEYKPIKCNVFFDNTKEIVFEKGKVTFYKTQFYKNKKYSASIKSDEIRTIKTVNDKLKDGKVQNIEKVTRHSTGRPVNNLELADFKTTPERRVKLSYPNMDIKVRNYLESR